MPRFLPYRASVNVDAIDVVIRNAEQEYERLYRNGSSQSMRAADNLRAAIDKVTGDLAWSRKHRCTSCGGAGCGHDGDTWDQSDVCSACKGLGVKGVEE